MMYNIMDTKANMHSCSFQPTLYCKVKYEQAIHISGVIPFKGYKIML